MLFILAWFDISGKCPVPRIFSAVCRSRTVTNEHIQRNKNENLYRFTPISATIKTEKKINHDGKNIAAARAAHGIVTGRKRKCAVEDALWGMGRD